MRAGAEVRVFRPARFSSPRGVEKAAASVALDKRLCSAFDGNEGNEEEADVMVQPLQPGRGDPAAWAEPRLLVHLDFFGL